jgi:hypothetical protein
MQDIIARQATEENFRSTNCVRESGQFGFEDYLVKQEIGLKFMLGLNDGGGEVARPMILMGP